MKIDLIVDLQYGSTGKGLLAGYLAEEKSYDAVVTCNMPNAGHTYIDSKGQKMIHKVLPNGIVSDRLKYVFIGPGAVISLDRLAKEVTEAREMGYLNPDLTSVFIHPSTTILRDEHQNMERETLNGISSTMQGSMAATIHKMTRDPKSSPLAKDYCPGESLAKFMGVRGIYVLEHAGWTTMLSMCNNILAEGSQGFSLGLNQRFWPYCTSRECTPARLISDMGLPYTNVTVYGTLRTFPIRVGNTENGYSGDVYGDQEELTWEELGQEPEKTTVTQRVRRVFTFSLNQLNESLWHCRPDHLFLNFCNYMDGLQLNRLMTEINAVSGAYNTRITYTGHGPEYKDVKS